MQQSLSFTIPYTSSAIRATVVALNQMDNDLNGTVGLFVESQVMTVQSGTETMLGFVPISVDAPTQQSTPAYQAPIQGSCTDAFTPPPPDEEPAAEGSVDANGMVWDERIHASTKTFVVNGTWKMKRGVDKAVVDQVVSELMGNVDTTPTQSSGSTPLPPVEVITESTPPPPTAAPDVNAFRQLLSDITKAKLAPDFVQKTCMEVNGCTLPQCKDDADKLAMLRMSLGL